MVASANVYWLKRASDRVDECFPDVDGPKLAKECREVLGILLTQTFPDSSAIIVRDRYSGYRPNATRHVLLVEVVESQRGDNQVAMVKSDERPEKLKAELDNWKAFVTGPRNSDGVLVSLYAGAGGDKAPKTLVYSDAYHVLGSTAAVTLEDAVLGCCRWGVPSLVSVKQVLYALLERLDSRLYRRSAATSDPKHPATKLFLDSLRTSLARWESGARAPSLQLHPIRWRREAAALLSRRPEEFLDPADYLRSVVEKPDRLPTMLYGCSHGDLHGRNVLVGLAQNGEDVLAPAVFDYEDIRATNAIGWDFVKLETELKIRAIQKVYSGSSEQFIRNVLKFEIDLASRTLQAHNDPTQWHPGGEDGSARDRLCAIVMEIRRLAKQVLGRNRDREWLEEYYFLLAAYGVRSAHFETYQQRDFLAAYISAGVAARQLSRSQTLGKAIEDSRRDARRKLRNPRPGADPGDIKERPCGELSHHARLALAHEWVSSGNREYAIQAIMILQALRKQYPHILEIEEELALAYLECGKPGAAVKVLDQANQDYGILHHETHCRWGRIFKDRAFAAIDSAGGRGLGSAFNRFLPLAIESYKKAYEIEQHYYPAINLASLRFIAGKPDKELVESILASLEKQPVTESQVWIEATRGEALLLLAKDKSDLDAAEQAYRAALRDPQCDSRSIESMRRQVVLLRRFSRLLEREWTDSQIEKIFG